MKLRTLTSAVRMTLIAVPLLLGTPLSAQAVAIIEALEIGPNVVFTGSGSLNWDEWTGLGDIQDTGRVDADQLIIIGTSSPTNVDIRVNAPANFDGPTVIGGGVDQVTASSGSGDMFGIDFETGALTVPDGYVSGDPLSSSSTYAFKSFQSLGIAVGSYTWTWGSGDTADSLTLNVGPIPVPGTAALLGLGLAVLGYQRRKKISS